MVVPSSSTEPQNILWNKTWNFSVHNLSYLQFLVGWLCNILEQKVYRYTQLPAYSWITARWTVLLGLISVHTASVWVPVNSAKSSFYLLLLSPQQPAYVFAWTAVCLPVQWLLELATWKLLLWCIFIKPRNTSSLFSRFPCLVTVLERTKHTTRQNVEEILFIRLLLCIP